MTEPSVSVASPRTKLLDAIAAAIAAVPDREKEDLHEAMAVYELKYPRSIRGLAPLPELIWGTLAEAARG